MEYTIPNQIRFRNQPGPRMVLMGTFFQIFCHRATKFTPSASIVIDFFHMVFIFVTAINCM